MEVDYVTQFVDKVIAHSLKKAEAATHGAALPLFLSRLDAHIRFGEQPPVKMARGVALSRFAVFQPFACCMTPSPLRL